MGARFFPKEHLNVGRRPVLPVVLTKHAVKRYRERFAKGATLPAAQESLRALVDVAVWANGKTSAGRLVLVAGEVYLVVQRWECKYRVVTVYPLGDTPVAIGLRANVRPPNPNAAQATHRGAAYEPRMQAAPPEEPAPKSSNEMGKA